MVHSAYEMTSNIHFGGGLTQMITHADSGIFQSPDFDSFNPNVLFSFSDLLRKHFLFIFSTTSLGNIFGILY